MTDYNISSQLHITHPSSHNSLHPLQTPMDLTPSCKVAAYALQDEGLDTVDANRHLGFGDDERTYDIVPSILQVGRFFLLIFSTCP